MHAWTCDDAPPLDGRTAIVTGANTGIGYETARMLAARGAHVILACRDRLKATEARKRIAAQHPNASVEIGSLDLADLASVSAFAESCLQTLERLDLLIENAGVMTPPFSHTAQRFELQFGTNHIGHFALSARLFPLLARTPRSRVVVVSSVAAYRGAIDFDDPNCECKPYRAMPAYAQSKLANLLFALELSRRLVAAGASIRVTAAHPGWTATELQRHRGIVSQVVDPLLAMSPARGALPTLRAAVAEEAESGSYWGPARVLFGPPVRAKLPASAMDEVVAKRLWMLSESLSGVRFGSLGAVLKEKDHRA